MAEATTPVHRGWGVVRPGDRVAHYYKGAWSLCGRVGFYFGPVDPVDKPSPDDCTPCRRKLDKAKKDAEGNK
jgi:hypothetical protein